MRRGNFSTLKMLLMFLVSGILGVSCTQYKIPDYSDVASCVGCHTNYTHLKDVYSPDSVAPAGGCGGEAPHFEPYDRVYLGGEGYSNFKSGYHNLGCTKCHGGTDGTHEKNLAHSGNFIAHPSDYYDQKCGSCHQEIAEKFATSLHQGTGQKRKVTMRMGLAGPQEFDQLPAHQIEGYNANCATCHGTCGNCHVNRPPIGGGGLASGHDFVKNPSMLNTCVSCHSSRGGHAYLGVAAGTDADVHLTDAGYECMDCHTGMELHGNGDSTVTHRYAYSELPSCDNISCHTAGAELPTINAFHTKHYEDFNCQVCHAQDYNNCGSCHIHGDGARVPSYMDFKIAKNPIPGTKAYEFALVRRTLAAPDNWSEYGVETYSDFDAFPTYNFTTPHNILRITSRTDVGGNHCAIKCHIRTEIDSVYNKNLYLFEADLLDWEVSSTSHITVDGSLPAGWFN